MTPPPTFAELGLKPVVTHALRKLGVETPFPIQAASIPDAVSGRDILGRAPTGSGKTLAFGLPLLHRLSGNASRPARPRGLVLVPTRELALQIELALEEPALAAGVRIAAFVGGVPLKRHIDRIGRGVDVVIATPGRLEDLVGQGAVSLADVSVTVVDEADRMADLGFLPQVRQLLDRTASDGQRMLFSATLDGDVADLISGYLHDPAVHSVDVSASEESTVRHHFFRVDATEKHAVATTIAAREGRTLVFLRTKHAVDRFTDMLRAAGVSAVSLHGDKTQAARTRSLASFADGTVPVLVATDVAARGIHVDGISLVLHVDPPQDPKDYVHRAGRTARAGASGTVATLIVAGQEDDVRALATSVDVEPQFVDVTAASRILATTVGARRPSGIPVASDSSATHSAKAHSPRRSSIRDGSRGRTPSSGGPRDRTRRRGR